MDPMPTNISVLVNSYISDARVRVVLALIDQLGPGPSDAAGVGRVIEGLESSLSAVIRKIQNPSSELLDLHSNLNVASKFISDQLSKSEAAESSSPLNGRRLKFPIWALLSDLADPQVPHIARLLCGTVVLSAWANPLKKHVSRDALQDIRNASKEEDFTESAVAQLLNHLDVETQTEHWPRRLRRTWRKVLLQYSVDQEIPEIKYEDRVAGQLLSSALYANPSRRAGAVTNRQLSPLQLQDCLAHISTCIRQDEFIGALGYLVCTTSLTPNLAAATPLEDAGTHCTWTIALNVRSGYLKLDASILAPKAASAGFANVEASSFVITKPLPADLARNLRLRLERFPSAKTLHSLFPGSHVPDSDNAVVPCTDELVPSWARFRQSTGSYCRRLGMDNLESSLLSGDFVHSARSKLYYACISAAEIFRGSQLLYRSAGFAEPVALPQETLFFGCLVVPSIDQIQRVDKWWREELEAANPGKNGSLERLLEFHNSFVCLTAFRVSAALALRGRRQLVLRANIDEVRDRFIHIDDKTYLGRSRALPVPVAPFCADTISAYRVHCIALRRRLRRMGLQSTPLAVWCQNIEVMADVPLFQRANAVGSLQPIGTQDYLNPLPEALQIAPDFGRKLCENLLRGEGVRATDIDAVLRHTVIGQSSVTSISDFTPLQWFNRVAPAMQKILVRMFGDVTYGLSRS